MPKCHFPVSFKKSNIPTEYIRFCVHRNRFHAYYWGRGISVAPADFHKGSRLRVNWIRFDRAGRWEDALGWMWRCERPDPQLGLRVANGIVSLRLIGPAVRMGCSTKWSFCAKSATSATFWPMSVRRGVRVCGRFTRFNMRENNLVIHIECVSRKSPYLLVSFRSLCIVLLAFSIYHFQTTLSSSNQRKWIKRRRKLVRRRERAI